jgi:hypothetical protein
MKRLIVVAMFVVLALGMIFGFGLAVGVITDVPRPR